MCSSTRLACNCATRSASCCASRRVVVRSCAAFTAASSSSGAVEINASSTRRARILSQPTTTRCPLARRRAAIVSVTPPGIRQSLLPTRCIGGSALRCLMVTPAPCRGKRHQGGRTSGQDGYHPPLFAECNRRRQFREPDVEDVAPHGAASVLDGEDRVGETFDLEPGAGWIQTPVSRHGAPVRAYPR